jgi:glyoxylase-like metal-dependent hydrolase (beta-lactamase superfamily II)
MELFPGVHRIGGRMGDRHIFQHLLVSEGRVTLIDTGMNSTPEELIFPYLSEIGLQPSDISLVLISHCDCDHMGGNEVVRAAAPNALFFSHELDRAWASNPDALAVGRYDQFHAEYGVSYSAEINDWLRSVMDGPVLIDVGLQGGEVLAIGDGWEMVVVHTPGHTAGSVSFYDRKHDYAVITDAIMWKSMVNVEGQPVAPPSYLDVDWYFSGIQALEILAPGTLLSSHFPVMKGAEVTSFLAESRAFVLRAADVVLRLVQEASRPLTLLDLMTRSNPLLGPFPTVDDLAYCMSAHARKYTALGILEQVEADGVAAWQVA